LAAARPAAVQQDSTTTTAATLRANHEPVSEEKPLERPSIPERSTSFTSDKPPKVEAPKIVPDSAPQKNGILGTSKTAVSDAPAAVSQKAEAAPTQISQPKKETMSTTSKEVEAHPKVENSPSKLAVAAAKKEPVPEIVKESRKPEIRDPPVRTFEFVHRYGTFILTNSLHNFYLGPQKESTPSSGVAKGLSESDLSTDAVRGAGVVTGKIGAIKSNMKKKTDEVRGSYCADFGDSCYLLNRRF
jgi:hypothetical protein